MTKESKLPRVSELIKNPARGLAPARFKACAVCGQTFDTVDMDQIFHHGAALHQPLAVYSGGGA